MRPSGETPNTAEFLYVLTFVPTTLVLLADLDIIFHSRLNIAIFMFIPWLASFLRGWGGWSGGAVVLGKLPVPGRPTYLDDSRARAYCACSGCGWGLFGHF